MPPASLDLFGLDDRDLGLLREAGTLLVPKLDAVLDRFYEGALSDPDAARHFTSDAVIAHAREAQRRHWSRLLEGRLDDTYFASVDRIGRTHAAINLPLELYMSAYAKAALDLTERLLAAITLKLIGPRRARYRRMMGVLNSAFALDIEQVTSVTFRVWGEEQQKALGHIRTAIGHLARGDLTHSIPGPGESDFPAAYDDVRIDLNAAARHLEAVFASLAHATGQLLQIVDRVGDSTGELSRRTSSQAASLEQTTAAMQLVNDGLRETSGKTSGTRDTFRGAQAEMRSSASIAGDAADVMGTIRASSEKIAQIIGLIDDIAFQTNLLALNAGVEAARAGEAGRGFAVVAGEVRTLAANASDAAQEIRGLIQSSGEQVRDGAILVEKARNAVTRVVADFETMLESIDTIAEVTGEQSSGLQEINQTITDLDRITQSNAAMVDETSDAMSRIREMAQENRRQIGALRFRETTEESSAGTGWEAEKPQPRPARGQKRA